MIRFSVRVPGTRTVLSRSGISVGLWVLRGFFSWPWRARRRTRRY